MIRKFIEKIILIIFAIVFIYLLALTAKQELYLHEVNEETINAQKRLDEAKAINTALQEEKANLEKPWYIEKVAREELGMTKPGEVPYILEDE